MAHPPARPDLARDLRRGTGGAVGRPGAGNPPRRHGVDRSGGKALARRRSRYRDDAYRAAGTSRRQARHLARARDGRAIQRQGRGVARWKHLPRSELTPRRSADSPPRIMNEPTRLNIPEWTVSELSAALKKTVEDAFGYVRVRGEISGFRGPHSSGHCYFALKDEGAKIDAVIWRSALARMRIKPEEGLEVLVTGRLTTYPGKSTYQIVIETLAPAGIGALMALVEERKKKLAAEGLFEAARKQLLPFLPERIGVVTSPTGAVIRDILHRLADRFPRHVIVWPVRVQGDGCAEEVAAAIH